MKTVTCTPYAKVNLGLQVVARREDGFHDLRTVFLPLRGYSDSLRIEFGSSGESAIELTVEGYEVSEPIENNLIWRAYEAVKAYAPLPAVARLRKRIPMGAGLGGGSADAAFALRSFAQHCRRKVPRHRIAQLALELGSDVPFFLQDYPCYAEGRGERLEPIELPLQGMYIVVVTPPIHVSTREAFNAITPRSDRAGLKSILSNSPLSLWRERVENDFWTSLAARYPALSQIEQKLYSQGAFFVSLSGSGPSIYGLFSDPVADASVRFTDCKVYAGLLL